MRSAVLPTYTKETDLFALAVHIFSLLMNGCHPFACAKQVGNGYEHTMNAMDDTAHESIVLPQPIDNIKDGFFPFYQKQEGVTYPLYAPEFSSLPQEIQNLFVRAFELGYKNPKERPTAEEWLTVLRKYQSSIHFGQCEQKHYYFKENVRECSFCAANKRIMRMMEQANQGIPDVETKKVSTEQTSQHYANQQNRNIMNNNSTQGENTVFQKSKKLDGDGRAVLIAFIIILIIGLSGAGINYYQQQMEQQRIQDGQEEINKQESSIQNMLVESHFYNPSLFDASYKEYIFNENGMVTINNVMYDENGMVEISWTSICEYTVDETAQTVIFEGNAFYYIELYGGFRASKYYNLDQGDREDWEYYEDTHLSCLIPMEENPDVEEMRKRFEEVNGF